MTQTTDAAVAPGRKDTRRRKASPAAKLVTGTGWTLIAAGLVILLYLVYTLFYTNLSTDAAQSSMLDEWTTQVGDPAADSEPPGGGREGSTTNASATVDPAPSPSVSQADDSAEPNGQEAADDPVVGGAGDAPDLGAEAVALLRFVRPGAETPPVHAEPLVVVDGIGTGDLQLGPGHYPDTAMPGGDGNFAVAGHRTTYGAPFFHLDELRAGDEIHVTDRGGETFVYEYRKQRIVDPGDMWVIGEDPFGTGVRTLTLTTCHPRFSARQRLVVFAQLVEDGSG